jgi:pSer/pThr/pTyr-binding forkhead associated (FHA) protein
MPIIIISEPDETPKPYSVNSDHEVVSIGRGSDNEIVIPSHSVSTNHCTLERIKGGYILRDRNSTNGILLDDSPMEIINLENGMKVRFGDVLLELELSDDELAELKEEEFILRPKKKQPSIKRRKALLVFVLVCVLFSIITVIVLFSKPDLTGVTQAETNNSGRERDAFSASEVINSGTLIEALPDLTGVTQSAPISWGPATDVFSRSEVINSGTLIEAFNAGGTTSGSDQTVNGVLFTGTSSLLPLDKNLNFFSGDTHDEAYNALLSSADSGDGKDLVSLKVGGGKLTVGTEYTIQVWYVDNRNKLQISVGDGESPPNVVTLNSTPEKKSAPMKEPEKKITTGQFVVGTFVAGGSTQTITLKSAGLNSVHIAAYQIRDRVSAEEMMANFNRQLSKFPKYSWDKVTRWAYARHGRNNEWRKYEIDIIGSRCKYIWVSADREECNNFKKAYPNKMYCFSYINLEKVSFKPNPFEPSYFLYGKNGGTSTYSSGQMKYNQANPDCRKWWLKTITESANSSPKSDVIFIDSLQKALRIAHGDYYDCWGGRVSPDYIGKALIPLLKSVRDELSKDFIIQGNFLRAAGGYTKDGNFSYVRDYIDSAYMEGFEGKGYIHHTIEIVQKAAAQGKMIAPNFTASSQCGNIEEARKKASQAMPTFWAKIIAPKGGYNFQKANKTQKAKLRAQRENLKAQSALHNARKEQDKLACMYSNFDFKLAYFLIMAGENSYMRISNQVLVDRAGTDMFGIVPPFPEFDRKLGKPISDGVRVSATTWQRKFEYCKVTLNVDHDMADIDWSYRSDDKYGTENMALGKPATQSSTVEGGDASRVVDGNTDGDMSKGSVNQTGNGQAWWQVDLEAIREIGKIDVWNRTGKGTDSTADFYVLVSMDPFLSTDLKETLAQPGVTAVKVDGKCATPTSLPFNIAGRYVRVQLTSTAGVINMAEVQVWSALARKNNPPVATAQSVKTGINNALDITLSGSDPELDTLTASLDTMPSHGKVTLVGNVATYQPDKDYSGPDSFTFKVKDADFTSKARVGADAIPPISWEERKWMARAESTFNGVNLLQCSMTGTRRHVSATPTSSGTMASTSQKPRN